MYRADIARTKTPHMEWLVGTADHPEDVYSFIEGNKVWAPGGNSQYIGSETDGWSNVSSLEDAIRLGRTGWEEGRRQLSEAIEESNVIRRALNRKSLAMDVAGAYPNVPIAVTGEPLCMITSGLDNVRSKPVVRVVVNVAVSGAVTAATIIRRGAAILSWVDGLESAGIRCEVEIVETGIFHSRTDKPKGVVFSVVGKLAHDPMDVDKLAFLLCHPCIQRRIMFAMYEREKRLSDIGITPDDAISYGAPTDQISSDILGLHSIYFPAMLRNNDDWSSPATAVAAVERMVMKALQAEDVEEDAKAMYALEFGLTDETEKTTEAANV